MAGEGQIWTLGRWRARPGRAEDFREAWRSFANWTKANQAGAGSAYLGQDESDPQNFFSFGPWDNASSVASWRSRPEFAAFVAQVRELCEDFQPFSLREVASV